MARNFAQIAFLLYGLILLSVSRQVIKRLLLTRLGEKELAKHRRGVVNTACYLTLKEKLPPFIFYLNLCTVLTFTLCALLQLTVGWFQVLSPVMKIFNSAALFLTALEGGLLSVANLMMKFKKPFILYRPTPESALPFASTIADAFFYAAIPISVIFYNIFAF